MSHPQQTNELIKNSIQKRESLTATTNALRLINGQGDGMDGITVDQYNRHFVIQLFKKVSPTIFREVQDFIVAQFDPAFLIVKDRTSSDGRSLDVPHVEIVVQKGPSQTTVTENCLKFKVDLNDTVNAGLFLDMRHNRSLIADLSKGKAVLNCFAYTCSFGVYCRRAGAQRVVNVDISRKALEKGKENYSLNGISVEPNEFVRLNCSEYLDRAVKKQNRFDVIILDPPSFSRHEGKVFSVKTDMPKLIGLALQILNPGGYLFVATNFNGITLALLKDFVKTQSDRLGVKIKTMTPLGQDADFSKSGMMMESYLAAVLVSLA